MSYLSGGVLVHSSLTAYLAVFVGMLIDFGELNYYICDIGNLGFYYVHRYASMERVSRRILLIAGPW